MGSEHYDRPALIVRHKLQCPACRREALEVSEHVYDMPNVGRVLIHVSKCALCGYKFSDVRLAEPAEPAKIIMRVESPEDLNVLVVKASSARVLIPELRVDIKPGPAAQGYITTIEGLLHRIREILEFACSTGEADEEVCSERLKLLRDFMDARSPFTMVILDPEGVSKVVSGKAVRSRLEAGEAERELEYFERLLRGLGGARRR